MAIPFSDNTFLPVDRPYSMTENQKIKYPITLGACSYIGDAKLEFGGKNPAHVLIGRFSSLAANINFFIGHNHEYKNVVTTFPFDVDFVVAKIYSDLKISPADYVPRRERHDNHYQIIIGHDVWIGSGATILGGVKIGNGAIIGANSMVTKNIPPYAIAAGNPARVVKYRFDEETIKKFMAVKWWDWDVKKICENLSLIKDVDAFFSKHYTEPQHISYEEIGGGYRIEKYRAEGRKIFTAVADFRSPQPLWRRIIKGFCSSNLKNAVLIFFAGAGTTQADLDELKNLALSSGFSPGQMIHVVPSTGGKNFSPYLLRQATHFITTREMVTLECLDYLYDTDVKIISALDDGIFDGEPEFDWNLLYSK